MAEADVAATDVVAIADVSASATKKLTAKDLVQSGVSLIDAEAIDGSKLVSDSVTATQLAPDSVGSSELANSAVDTAAIQAGAVTDAKIASGINGSKLSADTVTAAKIPSSSLDRGLDKTTGAIGHTNSVSAATHNGIAFDAQGHVTGTSALLSSDLPPATNSQIGGVSIPPSSGLAVSAAGALNHADSIVAGTISGLTYNAQGHITAVTALVGTDLPNATTTTKGGVSVPGPALGVSGAGALTHSNSGVAAGTYPSVTVDARGHVTAGSALSASQVPNLAASKITSGTFGTSFIADDAITNAKLADYSIAYIQEAAPTLVGVSVGTLWLQESSGQLRCFNGNSWYAIGFGRLTAENLRFCGTFDASTDQITGLTQFGTSEGFTIGQSIPTADDQFSGIYFVCDVAGSSVSVLPATNFDVGDWILCLGTTEGWERIDMAGTGGGASQLDDLTDVSITSPVTGELLQYQASGQWTNVDVISGGTF